MGLGGVVHVGVGGVPAGSCEFRSWSNGGEGGGELRECPCERHACVSYREGDKFHSSPVPLECRDEWSIFRGLGFAFCVAAEVPAKPYFDNDEGAEALVEGGLVRVWGVWYPSGVDEVWCCSVSCGVKLLDFDV